MLIKKCSPLLLILAIIQLHSSLASVLREEEAQTKGIRTCACEILIRNNVGHVVLSDVHSWRKGDDPFCQNYAKNACHSDCKHKLEQVQTTGANRFCNQIATQHKQSGTFQISFVYSYSTCEGQQTHHPEKRVLQCPSKCKCSMSQVLATSENLDPSFDENKIISRSEKTFDANYTSVDTFFDSQCDTFCESQRRAYFNNDFTVQNRMNKVCNSVLPATQQVFGHGYKLMYKQGLESRVTSPHLLENNICCNPVCKCAIKFKQNVNNQNYVPDKTITFNIKADNKGYKCNTFHQVCMDKCRKELAYYTNLPELVNATFHNDTNNLNIFISSGTQTPAGVKFCTHFLVSMDKPGVASYLEYDLDIGGGFPNRDQLFFGNLCCVVVPIPGNTAYLAYDCQAPGRMITYD